MSHIPAGDETNERLVCAVLAAQVAALRDRMDATATFDLLWRTTALLSWLSGLLSDPPQQARGDDPARERADAVAEVAEIRKALDELAFFQAQRQDFTKQLADCVVTALERMAVSGFSSGDLAALYVSDEQRKLHDAVVRRMGMAAEAAI